MWIVEFAPEFDAEFAEFVTDVRIELLAQARLIQQFGPQAKRPRIDTLKASKHANMNELRFDAAGGVWRLLLPSILGEELFCWLRATSRELRKGGSTKN